MNIDSPRDSNNLSPCTTTSKYFNGKSGMDESLSEFQEKKKSNAGPKNSERPSCIKPNPRKRLKRVVGQKDIRTALKPKKNELVSYACDFDKICKLSGIDVDPEQLQVAIALSKSLLQPESTSGDNLQSSGSLSSQERTGKIRTTLQEYGFKVPEIKVTANKGRKFKSRKFYKLLLLTTAEKQQIISDKFSQVLFQNLDDTKPNGAVNQIDISNVHLYNVATHIAYEHLKNNNIFYVKELIDKSPTSVGCLLRDWSDIPGRPASPLCDFSDFNFKDIECSQNELDTVLSGSLKSAQEIAKNKHNLLLQEDSIGKATNITKDIQMARHIDKEFIGNTVQIVIDTNIHKSSNPETVPSKFRSYSPDIFDDEVSSIMDGSKGGTDVISQVSNKSTVKDNDFMDLTECVNLISQRVLTLENTAVTTSQLSQENNATKRRSNDFMELTECIAPIPRAVNNFEDNIYLTQNVTPCEIINVPEINKSIHNEDVETLDLTQSSNSNDSLPFVQISGTSKSLDDTIILNDETNDIKSKSLEETIIDGVYDEMNKRNTFVTEENKEPEMNNLLANESSNSKEKILDVEIKSNISKEKILDVSIEKGFNTKQTAIINKPTKSVAIESETEKKLPTLLDNLNNNQNIDSEKEENTSIRISTEINNRKWKPEIYLKEFVQLSDDDNEDVENVITLDDTFDKPTSVISNGSGDNNVDLTQNSEEEAVDIGKSPKKSNDTSSLGKIGDISIDYDELFDYVVESTSDSKHSNKTDDKVNTAQTSQSSDLPSSSKDSAVFEISDKELDYSLNKSKHENVYNNFNLGGISIMDNMSNARSSKSNNFEYRKTFNDFTIDSYLPMVDLKGSNDEQIIPLDEFALPTKLNNTKAFSPLSKDTKNKTSTTSPKNSEYIIKIDQVTPMADYKSMTTPERNMELDKYGLKPFKRKRAIQLLTHIYNQTHPKVASCSIEDLPSPSKRIKTDNISEQLRLTPRKLTKSPKKNFGKSKSPITVFEEHIKSPRDNQDVGDKENYLYDITTEVPDIRDIECSEEDWFFQKREKAKMHSCRVPLHIAWQNYLGARRGLRAAILRYEPINIDVVHKGLVAAGHRYQPKDLLKFMDKKCITVKTGESGSRINKDHY